MVFMHIVPIRTVRSTAATQLRTLPVQRPPAHQQVHVLQTTDARFQLFRPGLCRLFLLLDQPGTNERTPHENGCDKPRSINERYLISLLMASNCSCSIMASVCASVCPVGDIISGLLNKQSVSSTSPAATAAACKSKPD